jgi:hypothetical protein
LVLSAEGVLPTIGDTHTLVFFVVTMVFLLVPVITVGSSRSLGWQRGVYWGSTVGAMSSVILASLPNLATGAILAAFLLFGMSLRAYFTSHYIKIGGRVIAFYQAPSGPGAGESSSDAEPYSPSVSAAKMWWLLVVGAGGIGAGNLWLYVLGRSELPYGLLGLGILVVTGLLYGVADGARRQKVARGQIIPFAVLSVVSAGIFPVSYLATHPIAVRVASQSR